MSDVVLIAIVAAVPSTIGVVISGWNNRKIAIVHEAVNGGMAAARAEIVTLKAEVTRLNKLLE